MKKYLIHKNSLANLRPENGFKKGAIPWNKGKSLPKDILITMRKEQVVKNCEICKSEFRIKKSHAHLRITCSRECTAKLHSLRFSGKNHPLYGKSNFWAIGDKNIHWKGGITPKNTKVRNSAQYKKWRKSIFERDNYTCQECLKMGGKLNADHIKPFSLFPELRFDLGNGRTLCIDCHKKTETYGPKLYFYKLKLQNHHVN